MLVTAAAGTHNKQSNKVLIVSNVIWVGWQPLAEQVSLWEVNVKWQYTIVIGTQQIQSYSREVCWQGTGNTGAGQLCNLTSGLNGQSSCVWLGNIKKKNLLPFVRERYANIARFGLNLTNGRHRWETMKLNMWYERKKKELAVNYASIWRQIGGE